MTTLLSKAWRRFKPTPVAPPASGSSKAYLKTLAWLHQQLRPRTYVEIGIRRGASFQLAKAELRIGVDPEPLCEAAEPGVHVFPTTSDAFFAGNDLERLLAGRTVDLAFIDGMHLFEFALRDFMNLERWCRPDSVILIHDCHPVDRASAERERCTQFWAGDAWKLIPTLKGHRPDLSVRVVDVAPSGLGIVTRLDPASTVLRARYDNLLGDARTWLLPEVAEEKRDLLNVLANEPDALAASLPRRQAA